MVAILTNGQKHQAGLMRFVLVRQEDISGVSGTGVVAEGVKLSNGKAILCWISNGISSIVIHESIEELLAIHGHQGKTRIFWLDPFETQQLSESTC